ncbi:hypothetical protein HXX76_001854 [Chlamydomonas incerta]|uniref:Uncharacterized protein n=1 Tax=Chlamydomonas incerta TaxID=51695 RepID=A0A835WA11_CHLIN|nr:hypothetical protein HXX76_001854 [Chlamydomonas incerta]|eukprot:KAG2443501.1 hypothetical protein HXX76_001854 [Chlamydomonas incerta]
MKADLGAPVKASEKAQKAQKAQKEKGYRLALFKQYKAAVTKELAAKPEYGYPTEDAVYGELIQACSSLIPAEPSGFGACTVGAVIDRKGHTLAHYLAPMCEDEQG